ncbi:MAG: DUF2845 domain-containing protein [Halioglobus sp.]
MKNKMFQRLLPILPLLLFCSASQAASMRCGRDLVTAGDHLGELLVSCGKPILTSYRTIYRSGIPRGRVRYFDSRIGNYSTLTRRELLTHQRSVVEVPVEIWTYNFGPRQFMREVIIVDGVVESFKTLGYGR